MGDVEARRREMLLGCDGVSYVLHHGFEAGLRGDGEEGGRDNGDFRTIPYL